MKFINFSILWMLLFSFEAFSLEVGFSEKDITPTKDKIMLGGYGTYIGTKYQTRRSEGVHDPLKVSTIILKDSDANNGDELIAISALDAIGLSPRIKYKVEKYLQEILDKNNVSTKFKIFMTASHSHATPDIVGLWGNLPFSGIDDDYLDFLEMTVAKSIYEASLSLEEVVVEKTMSNVDTTSPDTDFTSKLYNLWFINKKKEIVGSLSQWNAHPTILDGKNNYISASYLGPYRYFMNEKYSGTHILVNGMLGNVFTGKVTMAEEDPFLSYSSDIYDPDVDVEEYLKVIGLGLELAESSASVFGTIDMSKIEEKFENNTSDNIYLKTYKFKARNKNALFKTALRLGVLERRSGSSMNIKSEYSHMKIGEHNLMFVPGEISPKAMIKLSKAVGVSGDFITAGISNDWLGYILTKKQHSEDEYKYFKTLSVSSSLLRTMECAAKDCD
jgi:hypothetical protein